jgi:hypothetical protein
MAGADFSICRIEPRERSLGEVPQPHGVPIDLSLSNDEIVCADRETLPRGARLYAARSVENRGCEQIDQA